VIHRLTSTPQAHNFMPLSMRCPGCRRQSVFSAIENTSDVLVGVQGDNPVVLGQRRCPADDCRAHVFIASRDGKVIASYPAEMLDFDTTNLPSNILEALEEAVKCHAHHCYVAAGIMVRKTLEELCRDRGATGDTLKARVTDLQGKIVLPQELIDGLDNLRLLGNDAAHIESQTFNQVGQEEVEVSIEVTKEVLKAVYQYSDLLRRLHSLKKPEA
jgi:hypothetical protein